MRRGARAKIEFTVVGYGLQSVKPVESANQAADGRNNPARATAALRPG
jgi:hypothetical protein